MHAKPAINDAPLLSIIIATYNAGHTLERCLQSILSQDYKDIEILIQDGGSKDNTQTIVDTYRDNIAFFATSVDNGIYDAWNRAIPYCRGEWISFIGADDYFIDRQVLLHYSLYLKQIHSKHKIVYGINHIVNYKGDRLYTVGQSWSEVEKQFQHTMCLPHPGLMHHRSLFDQIGLFNDSYKIAGDYELLLRAIKVQTPEFWPNVVCATPIGGISTLPVNNIRCLIEIHRAKKQHGIYQIGLSAIKQWAGAIIRLSLWYGIGEKRFRLLLDQVRKIRGLAPFWTRAI